MGSPTADVAVAGGGIIGASIAWRLAQAGCKVILLDAGSIGGESSWAGAGMLAPGGEIERRSPWTEFALKSSSLYPEFLAELHAESGFEIDYQRHGALDLAFSPEEWAAIQARAAAQAEMGIVSERLDGAAVRELAPLLERDISGAVYFPGDSVVNPRHVTYALQVACERRHVEIHEHQGVTAIRARGGSVEIDTPPGILSAACAVICAGARSGGIAVWLDGERLPIPASFPVKGHLLGYRLQAGSLRPILRHGATYMLQRTNGFTVAGSSMERVGFNREIDSRIVDDIHERACAVLPCLRQAPPAEPWIGFRPATESLEPEMQRLAGLNVWLSYGHYRNGILLAPATAERMSREIVDALPALNERP